MGRIRDSALFKATKDFIKPLTQRQYEAELAKVKAADSTVSWHAKNIGAAFIWDRSPQGLEYWYAIETIIERNQRVAN